MNESAKETVKRGYNRMAAQYLRSRSQDSEDVQLLDELIERLPAGGSVLDAGCGAGLPIAHRLSQKFQVTGVDFSETQIDLARQNVPNAEFICQDLTTVDFPEASFDAICSYYAIIHVPREEHQALLQKFYKFLKPGGVALLCLGANSIDNDIDPNFYGERMYWSHFGTDTYLQMLKDCGFHLIWSRYVADEMFEGAGHLFVLAEKPD